MNVKLIGKHEKDSRACRDGLALTLDEMMAQDKSICYVDCDLMGCINTKRLREHYPDRAFEAGIAEGNAAGVSAGLAATGKKVFFHSFGTFSSRRCYDQIYMSAAYAGLTVHVLGSDAGVTAAFNGGTHMPFEDIAIMRSIPEITVVEPADAVAVREIVRMAKEAYGVWYIRLHRKTAPAIYEAGTTFEVGKANLLRDGKDVTIIAMGFCVAEALKAAELLEKEGIQARVLDMFCVKPLDETAVIRAAQETGAVVTAENHNVINGLGSAVADVLASSCWAPLEKVGVQDEFGEVGPVDYLQERFGLTAQAICEKAKKAIARK